MGRVHHLMRTLPINIYNAPGCEFVVVNYNSKDGTHEWMRDNMRPWIDRGIVKYYRTQIPEKYISSHAKNIAHRQATGDILCNLDADNFVVDGFVDLIRSVMKNKKHIMTGPIYDMFDLLGSRGKVSVLREHYYSVNGYDEEICSGWGYDDTDFQYRVAMKNNLLFAETPSKFCLAIDHSDQERTKNFIESMSESIEINRRIFEKNKEQKRYVANKDKDWGFALDLSSDI